MTRRSEVPHNAIVAVNENGALVQDPALTPVEHAFIEIIGVSGPAAMLDRTGWTQERLDAFLARPNVVLALDRFRSLLADADAEATRARLNTRRKMLPMLPSALNLIRRAMEGFDKRADGDERERALPPTKDQLDAAYRVLDMCGVGADGLSGGDVNITQVNIGRPGNAAAYDRNEVVRRDRIRRAVEALVDIQATADKRIGKVLSAGKKRKKIRRLREDE